MNKPGCFRNSLLLIGFCAMVSAETIPDIQLNAILGKKIIVTIDGGQHTLKEGELMDNGLELIEVDMHHAIFLWEGRQIKLEPSSRISTAFTEREIESISILRDASSHYFVTGNINGRSTQFMVDTGATVVALNTKDADQLGIDWQSAPKTYMSTAGGVVTGYALHLSKVTIKGITVHQVEAVVIPQQNAPILLGMSFLRHFDMSESDNVLTLKKKF